MKPLNDFLRETFAWGSPACGVLCGAIGIVVAALWLTIGFWKLLFVAALCGLGVFMGGVADKETFLKRIANRIFPKKGE